MAGQIDINRVQLAVRVDLDVAAAVRTVARQNDTSVSRWLEQLVTAAVLQVCPTPEDEAWAQQQKSKNVLARQKADALTASGHYRKAGWEEIEARRRERMQRFS